MKKEPRKVAVIVPVYKEFLDELERISYCQLKRVLGQYDIFFACPESLQAEYLKELPAERFADFFFDGINGYNLLMLSKEFYQRFLDYDYLLIYQLDAFVFSDRLSYFCGLGYDYIGAPWSEGVPYSEKKKDRLRYVGNGGFSLRNVSAMLRVLEEKQEELASFSGNEDVFYAFQESVTFTIAPIEVARTFSIEMFARECWEQNGGELPFGCHDWKRRDYVFWKPIIEQQGYSLPEQITDGNRDEEAEKRKLRLENLLEQQQKDGLSLLRGKRVYIYGTGKKGERIAHVAGDCGVEILGFLDQIRLDGTVGTYPIVEWEEVPETGADGIVIAALASHYPVIVSRIEGECLARNFTIWGCEGQELLPETDEEVRFRNAVICGKTKADLLEAIKRNEVISFDIFDTLVMRRVCQPTDLFSIVEKRCREKGIVLENFKKERCRAEQQSPEDTINQIYERLAVTYRLTREEMELVLAEEIACEKDYLVPRLPIVECLEAAIQMGKTVNLISDMYLPAAVLQDLLQALGIVGYREILVSCDYHKNKGNGLFEKYMERYGSKRCLHIGDNPVSDVICAKRAGIEAFAIKSGYELLKLSRMKGWLSHVITRADRRFLGNVVAQLFQDPFCLHNGNGYLTLESPGRYANAFITPMVVSFLWKLQEWEKEEKLPALLAARDGYLWYRILQEWREESFPYYYLLISRQLALKCSLKSVGDVEQRAADFFMTLPQFAKDLFPEEKWEGLDRTEYFRKLLDLSAKEKRAYDTYLKKQGISLDAPYVFCDLVSSGTSQECLNRNYASDNWGLYMHLPKGAKERYFPIQQVFAGDYWVESIKYTNLLEKFMTAPWPSVCGMDEGGNPIYKEEIRSSGELELLRNVQEQMIAEALHYMENFPEGKRPNPELVYQVFRMALFVFLKGDAEALCEWEITDDIGGKVVKMLER